LQFVKELERVSNLFILAAEKVCAYEELIRKELETKKNRDDFLMDYDIEIRLIPYLRGYEKNESDIDCFMYVLCEPLGNRNLFTYCIDRYCDKTANYNYTMFLCDDNNQPLDCFKDKFISYAIYELKDSMTWSYYDIMNINRISIDVKVNYQSFLGEYS